jgi:hypothetical protein
MRAEADVADDIEVVVLLGRIFRSQLEIIEARLAELQHSSPGGREAEVLTELCALSKAASGILGSMKQSDFQEHSVMAS